MIEVYVNDRLVDLPKSNLDLGIDYAIFDVNSIGNRQGVRSYSLDLPLTNNNKQIFESAEMITNTGSLPYTKIKARILVDGIDIQIRFCTLKQAGSKFKCEFYGGNTDIFYDLKDLSVRDIDFREWNHFWVFDTVLDSRTNNEGFIYPLIDMVYPTSGITEIPVGSFRTDMMLPLFYVDTILNRIFSDVGVSFVNEIASEQWYLDNPLLVYGFTGQQKDDRIGRYSAKFRVIPVSPASYEQVMIYDSIIESEFNYFANDTVTGNYSTGFIFADNSVTGVLSGTLYIENASGVDLPLILGASYSDGGAVRTRLTDQVFNIPSLGVGVYYQLDFSFGTVTSKSDELGLNFIQLFYSGDALLNIESSPISDDSFTEFECTAINEYSDILRYSYGDSRVNCYITTSMILPNLSQADFVKAYCQQFGLIIVHNLLINEIRFVRLDKILANLGQAKDWSSKIDLKKIAEITYTNEAYAQKNNFKYKDEQNETKPSWTDGILYVNNTNLEYEKDILELPYSATNDIYKPDGADFLKCSKIDVFEKVVDEDTSAITYNPFANTANMRVLFVEKKDVSDLPVAITYLDGSTSASPTDSLPFTWFIQTELNGYVAKEYNLGFGNNLLEKNYDLISGIIDRTKILNLQLRLTAADINQLDFTIPIFLSQYESYFYINKIEGYSPNSNTSCSVELVKLNL